VELQVAITNTVKSSCPNYTADELPLKNQTAFCVNECPYEDIGLLQVVFTPGWNCTSSASGDCVLVNSTDHNKDWSGDRISDEAGMRLPYEVLSRTALSTNVSIYVNS
jgi:hypothetical protein